MGYAVLGIAAAGALLGSDAARQLALTGALVEMVAHGLITGSLFLIAGGFWQRAREYDLEAYGGLAQVAPKLAAATILARSEEHTSELQSLMRISYAVFCLKKKKNQPRTRIIGT